MIQMFQKQHGAMEFKVLYTELAYGTKGSRNALERLKNHETFQKIVLKGAPDDHTFQVLVLEIQPGTNTVILLSPFAKDASQGESRIEEGLNKLFGTDEHERNSLTVSLPPIRACWQPVTRRILVHLLQRSVLMKHPSYFTQMLWCRR